MKILNSTNELLRLERWRMGQDGGIACIESIILYPDTVLDWEGKQISIYDAEFRYIGCLYDRPTTYKLVYYNIENTNYAVRKLECVKEGEMVVLDKISANYGGGEKIK